MSETHRRIAGDQATIGYRPLPSVGSEGLDLRTLVYAGLGVALGIVVGTVMADGSWRALSPTAGPHQAETASVRSGKADRPAAKAAQTSPVQAQSTTKVISQSPAAAQNAAVHTTADGNAATVRNASFTLKQPDARIESGAHRAFGASGVSGSHRVFASHRHRALHGAARRRHLSRRAALRRRRLRRLRKAAIAGDLPPANQALVPADRAAPPPFMVEGEVTLSAYNALTGTIETYEGEAFALNDAASANSGILEADFSPNIHYRCDSLWRCTLKAGQLSLIAMRTR